MFCLSFAYSGLLVAEEQSNPFFDLSLEQLLKVKVTTVASVFEESALDAAASVSLFEREDWTKNNAKRLSEVLEGAPSVATYPTWGGAEAIAIRGYGTELSVRGIANNLEGIPLNNFSYATSLYDKPMINLSHLERVEMIRGPGSALYGTDAFHGVISQSLRSSGETTLQVDGRLSSPEFQSLSLFAAHKINGLSLNAGLAFDEQSEQNIDYRYTAPSDGTLRDAERDYEYSDLSGFITLSAGEKETGYWRFKAYANDYDSGEFPGTGTQFFTRIQAPFGLQSASVGLDRDHSGQSSQFWLGGLNYERRLSDTYSVAAQLYYWESKQAWSFDNSRYPDSLFLIPTSTTEPCLNRSNTSRNPLYCPHELRQSNDEHRMGAHLTLKAIWPEINTQWAIRAGQDRLEVDSSDFQRIALDGTQYISLDNPYVGAKRRVNFAMIQADTATPYTPLHLVYGARVDDYSDLDTRFSPRAGAVLKLSDRYTTKLLYGQAFRAPTSIEKQGNAQAVDPNSEIESEEIETLEWVNLYAKDNLSLEFTAFATKWKDGIVLVPTTSTVNQYQNTGENESFGFELSGEAVIGALSLSGSASYVESKNKETDTDYLAFPTWLGTLQANYFISALDMELVVKERIMLDVYKGDVIGTTLPERAPNYFRTDISLIKYFGRSDQHTQSVFLHMKNLFDQDNIVPSVYNSEGGLADYGLTTTLGFSLEW